MKKASKTYPKSAYVSPSSTVSKKELGLSRYIKKVQVAKG